MRACMMVIEPWRIYCVGTEKSWKEMGVFESLGREDRYL
jgi:hypothetical protein